MPAAVLLMRKVVAAGAQCRCSAPPAKASPPHGDAEGRGGQPRAVQRAGHRRGRRSKNRVLDMWPCCRCRSSIHCIGALPTTVNSVPGRCSLCRRCIGSRLPTLTMLRLEPPLGIHRGRGAGRLHVDRVGARAAVEGRAGAGRGITGWRRCCRRSPRPMFRKCLASPMYAMPLGPMFAGRAEGQSASAVDAVQRAGLGERPCCPCRPRSSYGRPSPMTVKAPRRCCRCARLSRAADCRPLTKYRVSSRPSIHRGRAAGCLHVDGVAARHRLVTVVVVPSDRYWRR